MAAVPPQAENFLAWCFVPHRDHVKHKTWRHPTFCMILMLSLAVSVCTLLSNYFESQVGYQHIPIQYETRVKWASFLGIYFAILFLTRYSIECKYPFSPICLISIASKTIYDMMWGCNVCILLSIYGLLMDKPLILGACLITISCDQVLFYMNW